MIAPTKPVNWLRIAPFVPLLAIILATTGRATGSDLLPTIDVPPKFDPVKLQLRP